MSVLDFGAHYDEETLIRVAEAADPVEDAHIAACHDCRAAVDEYRDMLSCIGDEAVWDERPLDETPNPQTIATLRSFVEQMQREDAEAEPLVAELLAGTREEWMPRLMADAKFRTPGVVRKLIASMPLVVRSKPNDAVVVAALAAEIAANPSRSDDIVATRLHGAALRELSFANIYVGNYDDALTAARAAADLFDRCFVPDHEHGRLAVLNAEIARSSNRVSEGLAHAEEAVRVFTETADLRRIVDAVSLKASLLARRHDFAAAIILAQGLLNSNDYVLSDTHRAMLHMNLGYYFRENGQFPESLHHLQLAASILDELHMVSEAVRTRWNVAAVLKSAGRIADATARFEAVMREFTALGMAGAAALVALDLAEIALARQDFDEVEKLCRSAIHQFSISGFAYSERAATALALLGDASKQKRASLQMLRSVAQYVRRLPQEPKLEFAVASAPIESPQNFG